MDDDTYRRVNYRQKNRHCFLGRPIFQVGAGVVFRASNQLGSVLGTDFLNNADSGLTQTYYIRQEQTKDIEKLDLLAKKIG